MAGKAGSTEMSDPAEPGDGLIDLQVNGYGGVDFSSVGLSIAQVASACRQLRSRGTSRFLATLVTGPVDMYVRNLALIRQAMQQDAVAGAMIAGFHIEGPFISARDGARGAHDLRYVRQPDGAILEAILRAGGNLVKILTLAPELPGVDAIITMACDAGVLVSMGHTLASYDQIERAVACGASMVTHLGNGIPNMLPRTDNPIHGFLAIPDLTVLLITDGHHLPAPFIRMVLRTCGVERIVVTSDAAPLAGMAPGHYVSLGGQVVLEADGKLHVPALGCLAGSSACLSDCADFLARQGLMSADDIHRVTSQNPARLIGLAGRQAG
jgi:N-acetylglucosamine-6-phosphate deacetylase